MARTEDTALTSAGITPHRTDVRDRLAAGAAVVTVLLTAAAFWLSYQHLHDVADAHGLHGADIRAWAWPATVDLFIVVGELLILRASLRHKVDWWAIGLTVVGSGGSIALNVAGVGAHSDPLSYIVAAVPPVAALLAFGALMRQVHERLATRIAADERQTQPQPEQADDPDPLPAPLVAATATAATPTTDPVWQDVADAMQTVADDTENVTLLTVADVAKAKGVAEGTVRSWVNRNKLTAVRRDDDGRLLFHPAAVAALD